MTAPNPLSLRQRGRTHEREAHEAPFAQCLPCWPGLALCGRCGHVALAGQHGKVEITEAGPLLAQWGPCTARDDRDGLPYEQQPRCGCQAGKPLPVRIIDTTPDLPGSAMGSVSPINPGRPFVGSPSGHRRSLRGRR